MAVPFIADVKRNCLDDGPGIRSTVFFKGCPLSCAWCHNPECIAPRRELFFRSERCRGARACVPSCAPRAIEGRGAIDRARCDLCGACEDACGSGALEIVGRQRPLEELAAALLRDRHFYQLSGGGVTLSGGEPTLFCEYAGALGARLRAEGVHVLLETCGHFAWDSFASELLPHLSALYFDLKIVDGPSHREHCGRGNELILANLERLLGEPALDLLVRIPLVPGLTATAENLAAAAELLRRRGVQRVALLPYNPLWPSKAAGLGRPASYRHDGWLTAAEEEAAVGAFAGFEVVGDLGRRADRRACDVFRPTTA